MDTNTPTTETAPAVAAAPAAAAPEANAKPAAAAPETDAKATAAVADAPTKTPPAPATKIEAAVPCLIVNDMAASLDFYLNVVGFKMTMGINKEHKATDKTPAAWPSVDFAMLSSTGVHGSPGELMLEIRNPDSPAGALVGAGPLGVGVSLYLRGPDPDAIHAALPPTVKVLVPPHTEWYGMRELTLADPNGYVVTLGRPTGEPCPTIPATEGTTNGDAAK